MGMSGWIGSDDKEDLSPRVAWPPTLSAQNAERMGHPSSICELEVRLGWVGHLPKMAFRRLSRTVYDVKPAELSPRLTTQPSPRSSPRA
jgi:hypothetical protein